MSTDEDLGKWLRRELVEHESQRSPTPALAHEVLTTARRAERRRSSMVGAGAAAAAVVVVAAGLGSSGQLGRGDLPPEGSTSETTQAPSDPTDSPPVLTAGVWAATLPEGDPPQVPYASGTALHLPTGQVVDPGGTDAVIIGDTVAGTALLVERDERDQGGEFRSWYIVVAPDGTEARLDNGRITGDRVQEAVVSPDGRWFSNGRIFDMTTGQVAGALPGDADMLLAWTPAGIVYSVGDAAYLWSPAEPAATKLDRWPATYPNGTDVGLVTRDGCPSIVRLTSAGVEDKVSRHCGTDPITVSPAGSWLLTSELLAINSATGEEHQLADRPVRDVRHAWDAHWLDEDEVLLSVPGGGYQADGELAPSESAIVVRCHLVEASCERATDAIAGVGPNQLVSMP